MTCDPHFAQERRELRADGGHVELPELTEEERQDAALRQAQLEQAERRELRG